MNESLYEKEISKTAESYLESTLHSIDMGLSFNVNDVKEDIGTCFYYLIKYFKRKYCS